MAYNYGLLCLNYGQLYGIVACYVGLLGFPEQSSPKLHAGACSFGLSHAGAGDGDV